MSSFFFYSNCKALCHPNECVHFFSAILSENANAPVSLVSGVFGPFPTIIPFPGKENASIFAGSLVLKVFISAYFVVGAYFAFKARSAIAIGLSVYCFLEIGALTYLMETNEFRKGFPHIPFFLLLAVYGFESLEKSGAKYNNLKKYILTGNFGFAVAIVAWNTLRF